MFPYNFAPVGWALCNGQLMPINQNTALFSLIGTFYGGDGVNNFALPNLQGCLPMHQGSGYVIGGNYGAATVTLTAGNLPPHSHPLTVTSEAGTGRAPASSSLADVGRAHSIYATSAAPAALNSSSVGQTGGRSPVSSLQPYLGLSFIISLFGIFPSEG